MPPSVRTTAPHHQAGGPEQVEGDAHETVHRNLRHHPAHQGRYVARRGRMGKRQPDVQRDQSGLGSGPDQGQRQDGGGNTRGGRCSADCSEPVTSAGACQEAERKQKRQGAEARHQQVDVTRSCVVAVPMVSHDQRPGSERHELPGQQEREGVVGEDDQIHAGQKSREEWEHAAGRGFVPPVAEAVQACSEAAQVGDDQEQRAQRIQPEMRTEPRQADRQG